MRRRPPPVRFRPPRPRNGRRYHVITTTPMDCGAACVAAICRFHGIRAPLSDVRRLVGTGTAGATLPGLVRGGRRLGLDARMVRATDRDPRALPLPAVLHVDDGHWVVLYAVEPDHVSVSDPRDGVLRLSREELERRWSGYAGIFAPRRQPATSTRR